MLFSDIVNKPNKKPSKRNLQQKLALKFKQFGVLSPPIDIPKFKINQLAHTRNEFRTAENYDDVFIKLQNQYNDEFNDYCIDFMQNCIESYYRNFCDSNSMEMSIIRQIYYKSLDQSKNGHTGKCLEKSTGYFLDAIGIKHTSQNRSRNDTIPDEIINTKYGDVKLSCKTSTRERSNDDYCDIHIIYAGGLTNKFKSLCANQNKLVFIIDPESRQKAIKSIKKNNNSLSVYSLNDDFKIKIEQLAMQINRGARIHSNSFNPVKSKNEFACRHKKTSMGKSQYLFW